MSKSNTPCSYSPQYSFSHPTLQKNSNLVLLFHPFFLPNKTEQSLSHLIQPFLNQTLSNEMFQFFQLHITTRFWAWVWWSNTHQWRPQANSTKSKDIFWLWNSKFMGWFSCWCPFLLPCWKPCWPWHGMVARHSNCGGSKHDPLGSFGSHWPCRHTLWHIIPSSS